MTDQALIRSILLGIKNGDKTIDTTPKMRDASGAVKFKDYMHMLEDKGLIKVKHKHIGGKWDIEGLTPEGENYLNSMEETY